MLWHRGSGDMAPLIFNLGSRWRWVVSFMPGCFISSERTCVTRSIASLDVLEKNKYLAPIGIWTVDYPANSLVIILTELSWLHVGWPLILIIAHIISCIFNPYRTTFTSCGKIFLVWWLKVNTVIMLQAWRCKVQESTWVEQTSCECSVVERNLVWTLLLHSATRYAKVSAVQFGQPVSNWLWPYSPSDGWVDWLASVDSSNEEIQDFYVTYECYEHNKCYVICDLVGSRN